MNFQSVEYIPRFPDQHWWRQKVVDTVIKFAHERYYGNDGHNILSDDWDNLIILDACRADAFEEVAPIDRFDEYRKVKSVGSHTGEWTRNSFKHKEFGATVYITANPYTSKYASEAVYNIIELWKEEFNTHLKTVPAEIIKEAVFAARDRYPNKRIVAHFMQPHHPFVTRPKLLEFSNWNVKKADSDSVIERPHDPFEGIEMGLISSDRVQQGYYENLEYVLNQALDLVSELSGRTVVSSDHGNLFGERTWPIPLKLYGHPAGVRHPKLVTVPYAVSDGSRRQTIDEGVQPTSESSQKEINNQLQKLGYLD